MTRAWLEDRAQRSGSAEALNANGRALDYGTLWRHTQNLVRSLTALGVDAGEPVAALASGSLELALLLHAAQTRGFALLPLNTRLAHPELSRQVAASGVRRLVSDAAQAERADALARELRIESLHFRTAPNGASEVARLAQGEARPHSSPPPPRGDERPLLWLFTSGTGGTPKAAELSQRALHASALGHERAIGLAAGERWLACMPMFHIGGLSILVRCALAGASAELHDQFDEGAVVAALASGRVNIVSLVPAMLARLLDAFGERPAPPALRCILLGGSAAPPRLLARAAALGLRVAPTYGLTEAASQVATRDPSERREPLTGRLVALPGTALRIVDERGEAVAAGAEGEICVRGPTLMTRYVGDREATARALRDGWLHTGDAGRLDAEGGLEVLDRRTDLIVSGGENIYPAEVEAALHEHPAVAEAGVVARACERFGARPVAWVVLRHGATASETALREHCLARLARFKAPDAFRFTDALPRNASGKLLRRELRERSALIARRP